jgi:hypothetical protein
MTNNYGMILKPVIGTKKDGKPKYGPAQIMGCIGQLLPLGPCELAGKPWVVMSYKRLGMAPADTQVVLSLGMGVESVAILLRWIKEPWTCPCRLDQLIVITAQLGNEFNDTMQLMTEYMLPLMRKHNIRYVQMSRAGESMTDGYVVHEDSRQPSRMFSEGAFKLSDEMAINGTVPQFGGDHLCAQKHKAAPIEKWLKDHALAGNVKHAFGYNAEEVDRAEKCEAGTGKRLDDEAGKAVKLALGFNADEGDRVSKSVEYDVKLQWRESFFPLLEWGWNREACEAYITQVLGGVRWAKSCCVFCPFGYNAKNRPELNRRHLGEPEPVADAMMMEHMALSLNPRGTLYSGASLIQIQVEINNQPAVQKYTEKLTERQWTLYRVRRIYSAPGTASRAVQTVASERTGQEALSTLHSVAERIERTVEVARGISYIYLRRRPEKITAEDCPVLEEIVVAAPAGVNDKTTNSWEAFETAWEEHTW